MSTLLRAGTRLTGLYAAALTAMLMLVSSPAAAQAPGAGANPQTYPSRAMRIIVPTGAGGITDIVARYMGQKLAENLGQPVVVENRPGAGGSIGTQAVATAPPDGYTLLWVFPSHMVLPALYPKLPYDPLKDLTPITKVSNVELILVTNSTVRAKTVAELVAQERANPGGMNFGAVGDGSLGHLAALVFNRMAGTRFVHVPYRGTPQVETALLANDVQIFFDVPITALAQLKAGRTRALAVTSPRRIAALPDVPTMAEAGIPGYEVTGWNGVLAPAGTPRDIIRKLNEEVARILRRADVKDWFSARAIEVSASSPEEFGALIETDIAKWAKVISEAGIKGN